MACESSPSSNPAQAKERATLRVALVLNAAMFVVGMTAGLWAQSTGLMADALDMLADASAYAIALMAATRGPAFKRNAARWSGILLVFLGAGILLDVLRRGLMGSEPNGLAMMAYSIASLAVNSMVLRMLAQFRHGEIHLRATWIFTRVDVLANLGVFSAGVLVWLTGLWVLDLLAGFAIGSYVAKESVEILREAKQEGSA